MAREVSGEITVKIEIQESEYKDWTSFHSDGIDGVRQELLKNFHDACRRNWIRNARVSVSTRNT